MKKAIITLASMAIICILSILGILLFAVKCEGSIPELQIESIPEIEIVEQIEPILTEKSKYLIEYENLLERRECTTDWYLDYSELLSQNDGYVDVNTLEDAFTDDEITLMLRTVETECHGGVFESKVNVANVILNRIEDERFSSDVKTIITQPNQFCYSAKKITDETRLALEYAFLFDDTTNGAVYFKKGYSNRWNGEDLKLKDEYNGHHFY